jgi:hypothetical protein
MFLNPAFWLLYSNKESDTYQLVFLDKLLAKVLENAAFLVLF